MLDDPGNHPSPAAFPVSGPSSRSSGHEAPSPREEGGATALEESLRRQVAGILPDSEEPRESIETRRSAAAARYLNLTPRRGRPTAAAVMVSFNKIADVRKNLLSLRRQTVPFDKIIVVDNDSSDGTPDMVRREFPEVELIVMPHSGYGACETFNIGFKNAATDYVAILDDDVQLGPRWLEMMLEKMRREPPTTALLSSRVLEPGMPEWFINHPAVNRERYMSTFRGCATLARYEALETCGFYDEHFFIYGNERDLTARLLKAGYRVLQYPSVVVRHGTPFGMKAGPRSLYYHMRNLWWTLFKHCSLWDIVAFVIGQISYRVFPKSEEMRADAVGTIGFMRVIRETRGGVRVVLKAIFAALLGAPRCLKERKVCKAGDFSLPNK